MEDEKEDHNLVPLSEMCRRRYRKCLSDKERTKVAANQSKKALTLAEGSNISKFKSSPFLVHGVREHFSISTLNVCNFYRRGGGRIGFIICPI